MIDEDYEKAKTKHADFWASEGLNHIMPGTGEEFPEGFHPGQIISKLSLIATGRRDADILEFGCGYGRLSDGFQKEFYLGLDINPDAIDLARKTRPGYKFDLTSDNKELPKSDVTFAHTVLLHIADEDLGVVLDKLVANSPGHIIIAELMDTRWRRLGNPPVYNRDPETYIIKMMERGYILSNFIKIPCKRYSVPPYNVNKDSRETFLVFSRV